MDRLERFYVIDQLLHDRRVVPRAAMLEILPARETDRGRDQRLKSRARKDPSAERRLGSGPGMGSK